MKFGYKIAAVFTAVVTMVAVPAAAAQAVAEKRVTTKDATVSIVNGGIVVKKGGVARNSVYMLDDSGNEYWKGFGALEGFDGRASVDSFYDARTGRYVVNMREALLITGPTARNKVVKTFLDGRLGDDVSWEDIADFKDAFFASTWDYVAIDGKPSIASQDNATTPGSPVLADLEAIESANLVGVTRTENCRDRQGVEICVTTFRGNVKANGTKRVSFRVVTNDMGEVTRAVMIDGKGRQIAKDVFTYNTPDVIQLEPHVWYMNLATL